MTMPSDNGTLDRAWGVVAVAFIASLLSTGVRFSVGPFVEPLMADFGFSRTWLSAVIGAGMLIYGLGMAICGRLADLWGTRIIVALGAFLQGTALIVVASTRSHLVFALAYAFLASLAFAATSHSALTPIISRSFDKRRGLAMTFLSSGSMAGIAVMTPLSAILIQWIGWRATYVAFAAVFLLVLLPVSLAVLRGQAETGKAGPTAVIDPQSWRQALKTRTFWILMFGFFGCGFSMNLLGTHGVPMLEHHGFSTLTASFGVGLIGLVSIPGSLIIGAASDRLGRPKFLALIYFVRGLGFLALLYAGAAWELYAVGMLGGLVWAGSSALTSTITADSYGREAVGTLFGLIFFGHQIGAAAGSYLGGWSITYLGTYAPPFVLAAAFLLAGAQLSRRMLPKNPAAA